MSARPLYLLMCLLVLSCEQTTAQSNTSQVVATEQSSEEMSARVKEFTAHSLEARISSAATQFGLRFIRELQRNNNKDNVIISPLSLQTLLNMLLLGAKENSTTHLELGKVLGYDAAHLLTSGTNSSRLDPHRASLSVSKSIEASAQLTEEPKKSRLNPTAASKNGSVAEQPMVFSLANMILSNEDLVKLNPEYEGELREFYKAKVELFSKENKKTLHERANKWVKNMTQNVIELIASEGDLSGDDIMMVLLNAAHFKGRWLHTFSTKATEERSFYNNGTDKADVKFMRQKAIFGFADFTTNSLSGGSNEDSSVADTSIKASDDLETLLTEDVAAPAANRSTKAAANATGGAPIGGSSTPQPALLIELSKEETRRIELTNRLNCTALMLPFSLNEGQELSMVVLLPAERDGLARLQAALDEEALSEIYKSLIEQEVQVEMPKFSFEVSTDAKDTLVRMGLSSVFGQTANLERMYTMVGGLPGSGRVDRVIHKAKITVDESGAEAAAASMAVIVLRNFITRPPTPHVVVDHPFLFIIRHNRSNMPLFMGLVGKL